MYQILSIYDKIKDFCLLHRKKIVLIIILASIITVTILAIIALTVGFPTDGGGDGGNEVTSGFIGKGGLEYESARFNVPIALIQLLGTLLGGFLLAIIISLVYNRLSIFKTPESPKSMLLGGDENENK